LPTVAATSTFVTIRRLGAAPPGKKCSAFHAALTRPEAERIAFLDEACAGDADLRREIESLLAPYDSDAPLETGAAAGAAARLVTVAQSRSTMVGRRLGPYEIVAQIGAGGMGEVYRARDTKLGRDVAIKILPRGLDREPERLRRLANEARAASALNHPHILTVYDIGEVDGAPFIAMELVDGETLRERLRRGPIALADALDLALQVALALEAAHAKGLVHRDIKPENVMVRRDGYVKVLDFGLAQLQPSLDTGSSLLSAGAFETVGAGVAGTPAYMSPEQINGAALDGRSDIYSFGVLLCELTTGINPFAKPTILETLNTVAQTPTSAAAVTTGLPHDVAHIIRKALAKRPDDRYQTTQEVAADVRRARRQVGEGAGDLRAPGQEREREAGDTPSIDSRPRVTRRRALLIGTAAVALIALTGLALYLLPGRTPTGAIDSIAVLPFVSASGDRDVEDLTSGIAGNIVNRLSALQLPRMRVIPWSTASRYRGRRVDPQEVGRALKVRAVLVGTVTQRGDSLIIGMELIDVARIAQIWGQQYRRTLADIMPLQDQITHDILDPLRLKLTDDERRRLTKHETDSPQAHLLYLKGRGAADRFTQEGRLVARRYFEQSIQLDRDYAPAHAGLGVVYTELAAGGPLDPREAYPLAKTATIRALEIDDALGDAHLALAFVHRDFDRDWAGAEKEFKQAIALNPTSVNAHHGYSHLLGALGRIEDSLAESQRVLEIDPLDPTMNAHLGWHYFIARSFDQAIAQSRRALAIGETFQGHWYLGLAYEQVGRYDDAIAEFNKATAISPTNVSPLASAGHAYAVSGRQREAQHVIDELDRLSKQRYISPAGKALVYVGLGDRDQAFNWLAYAVDERATLRDVGVDPRFDSLRSDTRFKDLLQRLGLAPTRPS
jgi:serine/threonine protein kinase/tetratricopeptide (TPR) repeat protein